MKQHGNNSTRSIDRFLGAGAILLTGILLLLMLKAPVTSVEAGMVVSADSFTVMSAATASKGQVASDEDALYIMDNHNGILLVYRVQKQAGIDRIVLIDGGFAADLFASASK
ncbi:MAG: hypothetical protein MK095_03680 [Phycisphaerales bacterium]|nr:hypothetical protein [Phycisphaerales bacterium]